MKAISIIFRLSVAASLLISIYWAWSFFTNPNEFPVKKVNISSRFEHVSEIELKNMVTPFVVRGFFNVNIHELRQRLLQLPWIASVGIKRIWPNKISIYILEQTAVAKWGNDKLLNAQGKIFTPALNTFPHHLPILIASDDQQEQLWQYFQTCKQTLGRMGLSPTLLELNARGALLMVLDNGIQVQLGGTELMSRLQRLATVYQKLMADKQGHIEYIDLRYTNGLAVK